MLCQTESLHHCINLTVPASLQLAPANQGNRQGTLLQLCRIFGPDIFNPLPLYLLLPAQQCAQHVLTTSLHECGRAQPMRSLLYGTASVLACRRQCRCALLELRCAGGPGAGATEVLQV